MARKIDSIPLFVPGVARPEGRYYMQRTFGEEAIAIAEDVGCGVDVGPADGGLASGCVVMTPSAARKALAQGRRVCLVVGCSVPWL
jgi:hypothetical protein